MSDTEEISVYDEVEIEDMTYDETLQIYHYPCPCGDRFEISIADLRDESNDIGVCPSCSLMIRVIFEVVSFALSSLVLRSVKSVRTRMRALRISGKHLKRAVLLMSLLLPG
jgi:diphthamide biosynthesis protein 3